MNINFKYLKDVATTLHAMHREDKNAYWEGRHVFSVEFEPEHGTVKVHVQWPTFRNLQQRFPNSPVEHMSHDAGEQTPSAEVEPTEHHAEQKSKGYLCGIHVYDTKDE